MNGQRRPGGRRPSLRRVVVAVTDGGGDPRRPGGYEPRRSRSTASPDPSGMPGAELVSQLVNWLMWVSLMASLGAVLYGAAMWRGGAKMGNSPRAEDGRNYVAGGAIGALLSGLAVVLVNTLFEVGRAGG